MEYQDKEYFDTYGDPEVHMKMLNDTNRNDAYREAVFTNQEYFKDKIVLDVGAGTGILSVFCAKAGAAKVYAVEASNVTVITEAVLVDNDVQDIVQILKGKIEELQLTEKVDIIISEWMGFYLFHESMLDSVLIARDKFLKTDGVLFPEKCELFVAPCKLPSLFERWDNVSSVKMNSFAAQLRKVYTAKPKIMRVSPANIFAEETSVIELNIKQVRSEELNEISRKFITVSETDTRYQGLCIWFTVTFPCMSSSARKVILSTAPDDPKTHWKQTVLVLQKDIMTEKGDLIVGNLLLRRSHVNPRSYDIEFEVLDAEEEEHPMPCKCYTTRCKIIKAMIEQYDEVDMTIDPMDGVD